MTQAGVDDTVDEYQASIQDNLDDISVVRGYHEYNTQTGNYQYAQIVDFGSRVVKAIVNSFGASANKNVAARIAYITLGENGLAMKIGQ